jgi:hypothetical protein
MEEWREGEEVEGGMGRKNLTLKNLVLTLLCP